MIYAVQTVEKNLDKIPNELKAVPHWRPFKLIPPDKSGDKPKKEPLSAHTLALSNNTSNTDDCVAFHIAREMLLKELQKPESKQRFHGVGMSLTGANDLLVIDLDHAINQDGSIKPHARELLEEIPGFVERSVSGVGFHIFTTCSDWDSAYLANHGMGVEVFRSARYIAITGDEDEAYSKPLPKTSVDVSILNQYFTSKKKTQDFEFHKPIDPNWSIERIESELFSFFPDDLSYDDWLDAGMALHHQTDGSDDGYECFDRLSARGSNYPAMGQPTTLDKWNSFGKNPNRSQKTIGTLIYLKQRFEQEKRYQSSGNGEPLISKIKDARKQIKKIDWLVDGVIKQGTLVMFGGMPSGGKTYLAIELMMSIASGHRFLGKYDAKQGDAVYIACEGRDSVLRRVGAWVHLKNNGEDVESAYISNREMVVTAPEKADVSIERFVQAFADQGINPACVFVDTMNYSLGAAKENNANDMTEYFRRLADAFIRRFGCAVVLVHHTSKDGSDIRGSSTIRGALDCLFLVSRDAAGMFTVKNDKHKDIEKLMPIHLEGRSIDFELSDGTTESNMALYPTVKQASSTGSVHQERALEILLAEVGIGGSMIKKELLAKLNYSSSNAARDIYGPLQEAGFIDSKGSKIILLKTSDFDV